MESFEIESSPNLKLVFDTTSFNNEGWLESYYVHIIGNGINASTQVDNAPYGESPLKIFKIASENWNGWVGKKKWSSLEGEYSLTATHDKTGHILLAIEIENIEFSWVSQAFITIEAGKLDALYSSAESFFKC